MTRIDRKFAALGAEGRKAFVAYMMAGDPDLATSAAIMAGLSAAGVDIIELGMPFTDPMADGITIQLAGQRALAGGQTLQKTLDMVAAFRKGDDVTPIVLMGYYNPIFSRGVPRFLVDAKAAGVDGLIVVDLPPEEDAELCLPAQKAGLNFIRLATPTTDDKRLPKVLTNTSGFVYYVSITGITGAAAAQATDVGPEVARIKAKTDGAGHRLGCRWLRRGVGHRQGDRRGQEPGRGSGLRRNARRRNASRLTGRGGRPWRVPTAPC